MDSSLTMWFFLLAVLIVGVLVMVIVVVTQRGPAELNRKKYQEKWLVIENSLDKNVRLSYTMAIMNADKLLDLALREKRIKGATMGERMKQAQSLWTNANVTWAAHKLRNRIAHEDDIAISYDIARRGLASFKQSLKDLGAI